MSDVTRRQSLAQRHNRLARRLALTIVFGVSGAASIAWLSGVDLLAQDRSSSGDRSSRDSSRGSSSGGSSRFGSGGSSSSGSSRFGSRGSSGSSSGERPSFGGERPSYGGSSSGDRPGFGPPSMSTTRPSMSPGSLTPPTYTPSPKPERTSERTSDSFGSGGVGSSGSSHKTTFPIPPSKPISSQYEALLNRSMFIRGKQDTYVRPLAEQPRPAAEVVAPPVYRPEQYLLLTGVVEERDAATGELVGQAAQVENTQTFTRERVLIGGVVGRGIVKDISVAGVQFELEGQTTTVLPGFFFDGHAAPPPGSSSVVAMTPPVAAPVPVATTAAPTTVPAEGTATAAAPATQPSEGGVAATPTTGAAPAAAPGGPAPGSPEAIAEAMRRRRQEQGGN